MDLNAFVGVHIHHRASELHFYYIQMTVDEFDSLESWKWWKTELCFPEMTKFRCEHSQLANSANSGPHTAKQNVAIRLEWLSLGIIFVCIVHYAVFFVIICSFHINSWSSILPIVTNTHNTECTLRSTSICASHFAQFTLDHFYVKLIRTTDWSQFLTIALSIVHPNVFGFIVDSIARTEWTNKYTCTKLWRKKTHHKKLAQQKHSINTCTRTAPYE